MTYKLRYGDGHPVDGGEGGKPCTAETMLAAMNA